MFDLWSIAIAFVSCMEEKTKILVVFRGFILVVLFSYCLPVALQLRLDDYGKLCSCSDGSG